MELSWTNHYVKSYETNISGKARPYILIIFKILVKLQLIKMLSLSDRCIKNSSDLNDKIHCIHIFHKIITFID